MDIASWMPYVGVVATLVVLEGLLSADNALVLAVLAKRLPKHQQKKALLYGIIGAFVFRLIGILLAAWLIKFWHFMAIGAAYLIYLGLKHFFDLARNQHAVHTAEDALQERVPDAVLPGDLRDANDRQTGMPTAAVPAAIPARTGLDWNFWRIVGIIELTDIAFSIDSIVAAVALVQQEAIPKAHQMPLIYVGGILGIVFMRFVAGIFLKLLEKFPLLGHGAYALVFWIGLKLATEAYSHAMYLPDHHGHYPTLLPAWIFWTVMGVIFGGCLLIRPKRLREQVKAEHDAVEQDLDPSVKP